MSLYNGYFAQYMMYDPTGLSCETEMSRISYYSGEVADAMAELDALNKELEGICPTEEALKEKADLEQHIRNLAIGAKQARIAAGDCLGQDTKALRKELENLEKAETALKGVAVVGLGAGIIAGGIVAAPYVGGTVVAGIINTGNAIGNATATGQVITGAVIGIAGIEGAGGPATGEISRTTTAVVNKAKKVVTKKNKPRSEAEIRQENANIRRAMETGRMPWE